jgi:hypothetical protein
MRGDRFEMTRAGFLSNAEVEGFLAFSRPEIRDIALELRNLISSACPNATEKVLWGGLSYHNSTKGGPVKGAICQIELERDQVRISFIHGARLRDPDSWLTGNQLSKRYLVIDSYEQTPWNAIRSLIEEAAELDPSTFGPLPTSMDKSRS